MSTAAVVAPRVATVVQAGSPFDPSLYYTKVQSDARYLLVANGKAGSQDVQGSVNLLVDTSTTPATGMGVFGDPGNKDVYFDIYNTPGALGYGMSMFARGITSGSSGSGFESVGNMIFRPFFLVHDAQPYVLRFNLVPLGGAKAVLDMWSYGDASVGPVAEWFGTSHDANAGKFTHHINNCTVAPTGNPATGGFFYVEAGDLKYHGPSGTVTTIAPA